MKTAIKTTSKAQRTGKKNTSKSSGAAEEQCALGGLPTEVQQAWADDVAFAGEQGFELGTFSDYLHDMLVELIGGLEEIARGCKDPQDVAVQALLHARLTPPKSKRKVRGRKVK